MKKIFALLFLLTSCSLLSAQDHKLSVTQVDSLSEVVQYYLKETTSKHFEDPKVPRFLIRDRKERLVFGVGGSIEAKMYYDHQGNRSRGISYTREDAEHPAGNNIIDFTMNSTKLVFKLLGDTKAGVVDALIAMDFFSNNGGGARLTQAYIDLFGLRIGKTNTAFRDDESMNLVDFFAINSNSSRKIPQVGYSYKFKNGVKLAGGVEFPQTTSVWVKDEQDKSYIYTLNTLIPDLTANVYYTGERIHLYGGVIGRIINYYDDTYKFKGVPACGVQLGMNWSFVKQPEQTHKLFAQGIWTHGMADCCGGTRNLGLNAVCDLSDQTYIVPNTLGGYVGYQAMFGKNTVDIATSITSALNHQQANISTMYDKSYSFVVNYLRKIITYGTVGAEFIVGRRHDLDGVSYANCRAYIFLRYDF